MAAILSIKAGDILWLPKEQEFPTHSLRSSTVPSRCFDHPVLILATNLSNSSATISILTTFAGSTDIHEKVRRRGHNLRDYLSIHPAKPLTNGIPTLHLCPWQKLVRNCWVNVKEPYQCTTSFLEESWNRNWISPTLARKLDSKSMHSLALYAAGMGFNPPVYGQLLRGILAAQRPQGRPIAINVPHIAVATPRVPRSHDDPRFDHGAMAHYHSQATVVCETTSLLPHGTDRPNVVNHGTAELHSAEPERRALSTVQQAFIWLVICGLVYFIIRAWSMGQ